ncbi:CHAT domain-containing tetratricopeptide repeat protein [Corallococcus carmarthensis]|uniref:CHAT domain-containing tetratricopeptide repeat protein n=1 Tax=Corallococcus carmarthensis TaxID=2316728 RepID=UPI00148E2F93|nr:CHAT domain-containing tetratricopeptide repeat protein [Corallococcus carmarthensis]NOK17004.1 CHAT domain-containing protein [Corallococcus carmarthensis]
MRWVLGCMVVMALGCASIMPVGREPSDARLLAALQAYDQAATLYEAGRYAEAVAPGEQALALREAVLGDSHPDVAYCLSLLGELYRLQGDFTRAGVFHERALAIREAVVNDDAAKSVTAARLLGFAASPTMETDRQAGGFYDHGHALSRRTNNLFSLDKRRRMGALASQEAALNENQSAYAESLNNLANLYQEQGQYSRAEPLYSRALDLRETVLGKRHLTVADSLNNLALLYREQGLYSRAEPLYVRALSIREAELGKEDLLVADSLDTLATLYQDQGLYSRAEPLGLRALSIREAELGKKHPLVADSLNNLANLYQDQGLYDRAEPLYARALAIREAAPHRSASDLAAALNNLATLYQGQGKYSRAEPLYARALGLWEEALGPKHPHVAASLNNLATLYRKQGKYSQAEPLYARALAIWEEVLGRNHPDVAGSLNNLATLYRDQGKYRQAEPLYERALSIREAVLGRNHPDLAASLNNLALLRLAQHRLDDAVPLFTRAFGVSEQRLRREALEFSEARLASFLQHLRADEEQLYALLRAHPDSPAVRRLALSAALLLKGRSVEETADISRAVYRSLGTEERGTFERLRKLRTQLASLSLHGLGALTPSAYQRQLTALTAQGDALEATLAIRSAPLRALAALPSPGDIVDRVAEALPEDGALVEFITYEDRPLVPGTGAPQLRCLALVLMPDASIRALDLGPAAPIEAAASTLRDALARRDAAFEDSSHALYQLAFQPLLPLLGKARRLFLSPDGQLALVPFAALHDGQQYLVDTYDFTYVTSGKDLLPRPQQPRPASSVVVLADPAFNTEQRTSAIPKGGASVVAERSPSLRREDLVARDWAPVPLPGSREEAEAIQRLFPQAQLFLGPKATKDRLLHLNTPGILHLATHGFFLEDATAQENSRAVATFGALGEDPQAARPPDPLLRSGLLLAGETAKETAPGASSDSALVTALELAGLDLWGTQLVVLSACDTGRGAVRRGQGVYGLRRAFLVAGAETVVMSLWKVDDATTRTLMETYYRHLLGGEGLATALREAMRELRIAQPHPHYWAPFIAMGRDTPLRLLEAAARP